MLPFSYEEGLGSHCREIYNDLKETNFRLDFKDHTSPDKDLQKIKDKALERRSAKLFSCITVSGSFIFSSPEPKVHKVSL